MAEELTEAQQALMQTSAWVLRIVARVVELESVVAQLSARLTALEHQ